MHRQKAYRGLIISINIKTPYRHRLALLVHHHLVMRHAVVSVPLGARRLMQRLEQHLPSELIILLKLLFGFRNAQVIHTHLS